MEQNPHALSIVSEKVMVLEGAMVGSVNAGTDPLNKKKRLMKELDIMKLNILILQETLNLLPLMPKLENIDSHMI